MENTDIIQQIEEYCSKAKISPSTLGVRALGNSRILDRLSRKIEKFEEDVATLRDWMAANPPREASQ